MAVVTAPNPAIPGLLEADAAARRISRVLSSVSLLLAIAVFAVTLAGAVLGAWHLVPIRSGSMTPALPKGSLAIATPVSVSNLRVGDTLVYRIPAGDRHVVAHRIARILRGGREPIIETKGDANGALDPWRLRLHGRTAWEVRSSIPLLGYCALYARRALLTLLVLAGLAAFGAAAVRRLREPEVLTDRKDVRLAR